MKKIIYPIIGFLFVCQSLFAEQELTQITKLEATAKVWGFLKYYHPFVAKGDFNWDQQLIDVLPEVKSTKTQKELSKVFISWIDALGEVKPCKSCKKPSKKEYFNKNFDLSWIDNNFIFSEELSTKLKYIENNRIQKKHYYVKYGIEDEANPTNEIPYKNIGFPNLKYRLLGLFRYWNYVEYFYPYKYLTDQKWNEVLPEMIDKMLRVSNLETYHLILKELTAKLDDSHVWIGFNKDKTIKYFPAIVKSVEDKCVVFDFYDWVIASEEGLKLGDIILEIEGVNVQNYLKQQLKYKSASNPITKQNYIYSSLLTKYKKNSVELIIKRENKILKRSVKLYNYVDFDKSEKKIKSKLMNDDIGYIDMRLIKNENLEETMIKFKNTKGLIFDLRGYPADNSAYYYIPSFFGYMRRPFAKMVLPDLSYPGKFLWNKTANTKGKPTKNNYKGKVVILSDDQSLSRSEFAAMSLQTINNAITIGSQTAASDGKNIVFHYLGGYRTAMTSQGVFYLRRHTRTQRVGIKIDIEVKSQRLKGCKKVEMKY